MSRCQHEQEEEHRVDKKSVLRLLQRLKNAGLVKEMSVTFTTKTATKENRLIVDPSVQAGVYGLTPLSLILYWTSMYKMKCLCDVPITPTPVFAASRVVWQLRFLSISQLRRQQTNVG